MGITGLGSEEVSAPTTGGKFLFSFGGPNVLRGGGCKAPTLETSISVNLVVF